MVVKLLKREISNLQKLDSQCNSHCSDMLIVWYIPYISVIVKLHDVSRTPNNLYMFLEYCMDGDLKEYLKKKNYLSESEAIKFFKHIVEGFKEL